MIDIFEQLKKHLNKASSVQEALSIKKQWNSLHINSLQKKIVTASVEEKREIGKQIYELKTKSDEIFNEVKKLLSTNSVEIPELDLSVCNHKICTSSFNPLEAIRKDLIELFDKLNFVIDTGKEIVSVEDNFDNLCIPENHPSRSSTETFYIDSDHVLRTHCTVNSVSYLINRANKNAETKVVTIGYVYRRDDESTRHVHQFSQLDFVWINKGINVSNLKWFLKLVCVHIFGKNTNYRFRNSYFPFTQPSFEMDMKCSCDNNFQCSICKGSGWIEILGAGLFRREILNKAGYSEEYECIAGGLGLERLALIKHSITDIRNIYKNNFLFLKNQW